MSLGKQKAHLDRIVRISPRKGVRKSRVVQIPPGEHGLGLAAHTCEEIISVPKYLDRELRIGSVRCRKGYLGVLRGFCAA